MDKAEDGSAAPVQLGFAPPTLFVTTWAHGIGHGLNLVNRPATSLHSLSHPPDTLPTNTTLSYT